MEGRVQALPPNLDQLELSDAVSNSNGKVPDGELEIEFPNSDSPLVTGEPLYDTTKYWIHL